MKYTRCALVIAALLASEGAANAIQITFLPDTVRSITVSGHGSVTAKPDKATVEVGVSAVDPDARKAKAAVDASVGKLLALAKGLGIADGALTTAVVNIEPRYDETNPIRLRGYEATQSVTVELADLSKLEALLDGAVQAGGNRDFNVTVRSSREVSLKQEAQRLALESARAQAELAVKQLGVRLGTVRSINLNPSSDYSAAYSTLVGSSRATTVAPARFLPGRLRIDADVTVVFFIEDLLR